MDLLLSLILASGNSGYIQIIINRHGAPGTQLVTEQWALNWESLAAGAGAVLAAVDARGAGGRGLGAHHTLHRRLGTVELEDQLEVAG